MKTTLDELQALGAHLSRSERRAMEAERHALSRFTALLLAERIGATFAGAITGVQKFGVFVRLDELMAEGVSAPAAVIGVPVGFIGAAESKAALADSELEHIVVHGRRGGSAIAAAAVNALASAAE